MTITLDLNPEIERGLLAQAQAKGISLAAYAEEVLAREAKAAEPPQRRTGQELIDVCGKVRGLLTDEEVDTLFARTPSFGRPVDFE